jgi:hypothetical protein
MACRVSALADTGSGTTQARAATMPNRHST